MNAKDTIRQMIREELQSILSEQARNWWQKPAEAEIDAHIFPADVHEATEKKKRPGVGKKNTGTYSSAGTIPPTQGRKLTPAQISNREKIGKKMLNTFRRGGEVGNKMRKRIINQLQDKDLPTDRKHQLSQIWANASGMAANGATPADVNKPKSKKSGSKKDKPSGENK